MLYEMAQFYDGEAYEEGSTLRGALKGWRRVGVTRDDLWPYVPGDEDGTAQGRLTLARLLNARTRRLLRYARIPCTDIRTMQHALAEGRALYACARYHLGWMRMYLPGVEPVIEPAPTTASAAGTPSSSPATTAVAMDPQLLRPGLGRRPAWRCCPTPTGRANGQDVWVIEAQAVEAPWSGAAATPVEPATAPRAPETPGAPRRPPAARPAASRHTAPCGRTRWRCVMTARWPARRLREGSRFGGHAAVPLRGADPGLGPAPPCGRTMPTGAACPWRQTVERLLALRELLMAREICPIFLVWRDLLAGGARARARGVAAARGRGAGIRRRPLAARRWPARSPRSRAS
jgi:hypothetical protein